MITRIILLVMLLGHVCTPSAEAAEYGIALASTPVLNSPDFKAVFGGWDGQNLKSDRCGQVRELEYIALPGSVFTIVDKLHSGPVNIYQVESEEYKALPNVRLYVESRFIKLERVIPAPRKLLLPPREKIVSTLRASVGNPYVWGGNVPEGVPELAEWYYKNIREDDKKRLTLAGLDCSGLLYSATGGWTPRNTHQLIAFGQGVAIAGKEAADILPLLQPLDLIVWNGHVIIVLDQHTAIESRLACGKPGNGGVVMTQLSRRIDEIMRTRRTANSWPSVKKRQDLFVVRRWHAMQ